MIQYLLGESNPLVAALGLLTAFAATCFLLTKLSKYLPKDAGREFAHDGKLSAGKPRGAGIIFVLVFTASAIVFAPMNRELCIYLILVAAEMLTGYMDDASEHPWNEYKKGFLDLIVAIVLAVTYLNYNSSTINIATLGINVTLPPVLFGVLTVILVWTSINVTNCADGVDGLSGTLALITLMTIYIIDSIRETAGPFPYLILLFGICILGYLWYNATPSRLMMGDAGSRAMGIFISIAVLKTGSPLLYMPVAIVLILDGGLGLVKVALLRFLKIHILKNTRTPLHDHVRKIMGWSNTQTVFRFAIIQIVVSFVTVYLLLARQ
ncbi:MAG: phospho-N-acetylmuramoyl-pentapeptide-transferase [Lachnospiraceae bacterium]|nr:phospho-N-acetylmuramoyl-pentapeptide-transferase [Lachnospiraceae bacterium]